MLSTDDKGLFSCIGLVVGAIVLLVVGALLDGYVMLTMWDWFIVPLGVTSIALPHAIGISLFTNFFKGRSAKDEDTLAVQVGKIILAPLLLLSFGWIVVQFM